MHMTFQSKQFESFMIYYKNRSDFLHNCNTYICICVYMYIWIYVYNKAVAP